MSNQETQTEDTTNGDRTAQEESEAPAAVEKTTTSDATTSSLEAAEEARNILELENEAMLGQDDMSLAPMMTYQKYLTMQEKRVRVAIRYSAEAGLRPFYLTVANQIKSAYPDVLLEKRILSPVGSDAGGEDAIFEVVVDGKTVIGKKNSKMLKVTPRASRKSGGKDDNGKRNAKSGSRDANTPDIAGGRSISVSMEKLDKELSNARKRRRPNTMYKSKEIASGTAVTGVGAARGDGVGEKSQRGDVIGNQPGMTEAVIRLERLKAMSTRSKI